MPGCTALGKLPSRHCWYLPHVPLRFNWKAEKVSTHIPATSGSGNYFLAIGSCPPLLSRGFSVLAMIKHTLAFTASSEHCSFCWCLSTLNPSMATGLYPMACCLAVLLAQPLGSSVSQASACTLYNSLDQGVGLDWLCYPLPC